MRREIEQSSDRDKKASLRAQFKEMQNTLERMTKIEVDQVPDWLIKGLRLLIETFMPTRINFRIYPFRECPSFQVLCNLKRDCFVDSDLEHLLYGYGNQPNVPLAVFGLITSLPAAGGPEFEPLSEFNDPAQLGPEQVFENAFRQVFVGIGGVDSFVRFSRYPNVTVHPIGVYRLFPIKTG